MWDLRVLEPRTRDSVKAFLTILLALSALLILPPANAKEFRPGDLRVCNKSHCVAIVNREVLPAIGAFYYSGPCPVRVRKPKLGAPYFELRTPNGYVTGIVATRRLDRFLTYGVNDGRFARDAWYAFPRKLSEELRRLTADMRPLRLTHSALARSVGFRRTRCTQGHETPH